MQEVEKELRAHERQWEGLREASERDTEVIGQLTASKEQLERELQERADNVRHLESLLEEVWFVCCVLCPCSDTHMSSRNHTHMSTSTCPLVTLPGWQQSRAAAGSCRGL